jgi:hypothetical protein
MEAITGTRRSMKELADGTLRVTVDIDMQFKDVFLTNFPIDIPIAIVRMTQEASAQQLRNNIVTQENRMNGLGLFAVRWCKETFFWEWLEDNYGEDIDSEEAASDMIKAICKIKTRRELNTNVPAAEFFNKHIRIPYMNFLEEIKDA